MWLLVPDAALVVSIVTLFYCLILFNGPRKLFRDSDTGWHIITGEKILEERQLPRTDPYSFTRAGQPWMAWEWGADCLMASAARSTGLTGVAWMFAIAIAAVTWLWFQLNWAVNGNFLFACLLASPMLSTTSLHWLARPHVFSWILMLGCLWFFENSEFRSQSPFRVRHAAAVFTGAALWANLHASFLFLPVVAATYAAGHLLRPMIWNLDRQIEWSRARWFTFAAFFGLAGSLLNPYGVLLHWHVLRYLADSALLDRVGEFQTFNFHVEGAAQILLTLAIAAAGGILALSQKKLAHFLLSIFLLAGALRSARGLPIAAILLLPLANGAITDALRRARDLRPALRTNLSGFLQYSDHLRLIDARLAGLWLAPVMAALAFLWLLVPDVKAHTGFAPDQFPVYAAEELRNLPGDIRLFAPDMYGGYIIYRYQGRRKVFFDGRSDFYGSGFMKQYIRLMEVRPGWPEQLRDFGITHAMLPRDSSLAAALEQTGWTMLYRDDVAVLFGKDKAALSR